MFLLQFNQCHIMPPSCEIPMPGDLTLAFDTLPPQVDSLLPHTARVLLPQLDLVACPQTVEHFLGRVLLPDHRHSPHLGRKLILQGHGRPQHCL